VQGLCLPWLIRRLGLGAHVEREEEAHRKMEIRARLAAVKGGLAKLEALDDSGVAPYMVTYLRRQYESRMKLLAARRAAAETPEQIEEMLEVMKQVRAAERQALHELQEEGAISDRAMVMVQEDVDLEELKFESEE